MQIQWKGSSDSWEFTKESKNSPSMYSVFVEEGYLMALTEEVLLEVASSESRLKHVSLKSAIACLSRLALRVALSTTNLNPKWHPIYIPNGVVKAGASSNSEGVRFFSKSEAIKSLAAIAPELADFGVWEEFVTGESFEVNGVINEGFVYLFKILQKVWDTNTTKIVSYKQVEAPAGLIEAVKIAIAAIDIDNSPFSLSVKQDYDGNYKVLEVRCHLSNEPEISALLTDEIHPIAQLEQWVLNSYLKSKSIAALNCALNPIFPQKQ